MSNLLGAFSVVPQLAPQSTDTSTLHTFWKSRENVTQKKTHTKVLRLKVKSILARFVYHVHIRGSRLDVISVLGKQMKKDTPQSIQHFTEWRRALWECERVKRSERSWKVFAPSGVITEVFCSSRFVSFFKLPESLPWHNRKTTPGLLQKKNVYYFRPASEENSHGTDDTWQILSKYKFFHLANETLRKKSHEKGFES